MDNEALTAHEDELHARLTDGVNELVTLRKIIPMRTLAGSVYWRGEGKLDGVTIYVEIWKLNKLHGYDDDLHLFTDAGYPASIFDERKPVDVNIHIITRKDPRNVFRVAEVLPAPGDANVPAKPPAVRSREERIAAWQGDMKAYGKPNLSAADAMFVSGDTVVMWIRNTDGTYTRKQGDASTVYAAKQVSQSNYSMSYAEMLVERSRDF